MAGWSALANGSSLHCAEIARSDIRCLSSHRAVTDGVDGSDDHKGKARCLFDQLLPVFYEVIGKGAVLPVPAMLGDGQAADLFQLFWVVRKRGGYDLVSKIGLWPFVAADLGFDPGLTASLKLIYSKYLNELDQWLKGNDNDLSMPNGDFQHVGNYQHLLELKAKFSGLLLDVPYQNGNADTFAELVSIDNDLDIEDSEFKLKNNRSLYRIHDHLAKDYGHGDKGNYDDDEKSSDPVTLDQSSRKRKRESLSGMLNWVLQAAKHSDDPAIGKIPDPSKWKNHGANELWVQVIKAREAQLPKRPVGLNHEQSLLQKKHKMHPSMYEDNTCLSHQPTGGVRYSERLPTSVKSRICSCCSTHSKLENIQTNEPENGSNKQTSGTIDILPKNATGCEFEDDPDEKHVSVGPLFQAEVPEWTGEVLDSDNKWIGTRIWPLPSENGQQIEADTIGKGRADVCECMLPGSVECVRFHIAEKRMKLKQELKSIFYHWRFDKMGEEVSLQWTIEEEKRFKEMVRLNPPSLGKSFWDYAWKYLPRKSMTDLLRYYFNAFLVHRRSYQNRVTPRDIDSDDDESGFGSLGGSFGHHAVTVRGSNLPVCTENKQCKYLDR